MSGHRASRLHAAPLAVTSSGDVLLGVYWSSAVETVEYVVAIAKATGRPIFIGVALSPSEGSAIVRDLDDAVHDTTMRLGSPMLKTRAARRARR